jgi:tyrosinase
MAIDTRKNALTMPAAEFENFLKACVLLKAQIVPGATFSVYDQWVAIHGSIMGVKTPGSAMFVNLGHQNIGFLAWHREYVRRFELALQSVVPGVTVPYWPWDIPPEPSVLFSNPRIHRIFFSSSVLNDVGGLFAFAGPAAPPPWWPAGFRWRVQPPLQVGGSPILRRGSPTNTWPPTAASLTAIENMSAAPAGLNVYWPFWRELESGALSVTLSHNTGHNIVGGYMANPVFSPNDPLFWLHHAEVDRIWSRWQAKRVAAGATLLSIYPPPTQVSPFNGQLPPNGHKRDDLMWPWVGATPGYSVNSSPGVQAMLPNSSAVPARRIRDTFGIANMGPSLGGYQYA